MCDSNHFIEQEAYQVSEEIRKSSLYNVVKKLLIKNIAKCKKEDMRGFGYFFMSTGYVIIMMFTFVHYLT